MLKDQQWPELLNVPVPAGCNALCLHLLLLQNVLRSPLSCFHVLWLLRPESMHVGYVDYTTTECRTFYPHPLLLGGWSSELHFSSCANLSTSSSSPHTSPLLIGYFLNGFRVVTVMLWFPIKLLLPKRPGGPPSFFSPVRSGATKSLAAIPKLVFSALKKGLNYSKFLV